MKGAERSEEVDGPASAVPRHAHCPFKRTASCQTHPSCQTEAHFFHRLKAKKAFQK